MDRNNSFGLETIQDEGLDEEQDAPDAHQWSMAKLQIDQTDASALQTFDAGTVTIVKRNNN